MKKLKNLMGTKMIVDFVFKTYEEDDTPIELEVSADVLFYPYSRDDPPDIEVDLQSITKCLDGENYIQSLPEFVLDKIEERAVEVAWEIL